MGLVLAQIKWALAHPCPLRDPHNWYGGEVGYAARHSDALRSDIANPPYTFRQAYQDIFLLRDWYEMNGRRWSYPAWGFSVDRRYQKQGGWQGLQMLCGSCPACSTIEVAGCTGGFSDDDHDEGYGFVEDPDAFDLLVEEQGLRGELARFFPVTKPLWFGLWIQPVMPAGGVSVLRQLFEAMERKEGSRNGWELFGHAGFLRALKTAERNGLELHVRRTPGGTIAGPRPHCPRCKADRELGANLTCKVCGDVCSPQVDKWGTGRRAPLKPLLKELGEARFIELVRWKLGEQKAPDEICDELVEAILERERTRPVWEAEKKQSLKVMVAQARLEARFCKQVLFKGIRSPKRDVGQFRAPQFRQVLVRCQELGITVTRMSHSDSDYNMDSYRQTHGSISDPFAQLEAWIAEGLNDWFGAGFAIPEALLNTVD